MLNVHRANRARIAVRAWREAGGLKRDDESNARDLMSDLLHLIAEDNGEPVFKTPGHGPKEAEEQHGSALRRFQEEIAVPCIECGSEDHAGGDCPEMDE